MVIVQASTVGLLVARAFKAAAAGRPSDERTKCRLLKSNHTLKTESAAEMIPLARRVVNLGVKAVCGLGKRQVGLIVIRGVCQRLGFIQSPVFLRRCIDALQDGERNWVNPIVGNLIVGERCTWLPCCAVAGCRIEDLALAGYNRRAEVDVALGVRREVARIRNSKGAADGFMIRGAKIVPKEEQLVLQHRASGTAAKVVVRQMPQRPPEVRARVEVVVLNKLESRAVEYIRPRLERNVGDGAGGAAKLGFEVVGVDVDRLDSFDGRNQYLQQASTLVVVDAFDLVKIALPRHAVRFRLKGALRVEKL